MSESQFYRDIIKCMENTESHNCFLLHDLLSFLNEICKSNNNIYKNSIDDISCIIDSFLCEKDPKNNVQLEYVTNGCPFIGRSCQRISCKL